MAAGGGSKGANAEAGPEEALDRISSSARAEDEQPAVPPGGWAAAAAAGAAPGWWAGRKSPIGMVERTLCVESGWRCPGAGALLPAGEGMLLRGVRESRQLNLPEKIKFPI